MINNKKGLVCLWSALFVVGVSAQECEQLEIMPRWAAGCIALVQNQDRIGFTFSSSPSFSSKQNHLSELLLSEHPDHALYFRCLNQSYMLMFFICGNSKHVIILQINWTAMKENATYAHSDRWWSAAVWSVLLHALTDERDVLCEMRFDKNVTNNAPSPRLQNKRSTASTQPVEHAYWQTRLKETP